MTVDELLWSWPSVIAAAKAGWERSFALSIARASKRPGWQPSAKQHEHMCRMVAAVYANGGDDGLIDEADE